MRPFLQRDVNVGAPTFKNQTTVPTAKPIEHQYLPIPTISFSEHAQSTYSSSNSSSVSSLILMDHNEELAEYKLFYLLSFNMKWQEKSIVLPVVTVRNLSDFEKQESLRLER